MRGKRKQHRRLLPRLLVVAPVVAALLAVARPLGDPPVAEPTPSPGEIPAALPRTPEVAAPSMGIGSPERARAAPRPRRLTLAFTGDILAHRPVWGAAAVHASRRGGDFDFRPMFARVRRILSGADLAVCHLETPLTPDAARLSSFPIFNAPDELARAIAQAGYEGCSTASNHSLDHGARGVHATLHALDAAGLRHAGTARSQQEARRVTIYRVAGVRVAHLSYTYGFNGLVPDQPWRANLIDPGRILARARRARAEGSDFTVVSLHWGTEYVSAPTLAQRALARRLARHPAIDLIVGHHAHVVQPVERLGGTYVSYGLGNFLSGQTGTSVQDGVILQVTIGERGQRFEVEGIRYVPTWVEPGTWRILPVASALRSGLSSAEARALRASWGRTTAIVESLAAPGVRALRAGGRTGT